MKNSDKNVVRIRWIFFHMFITFKRWGLKKNTTFYWNVCINPEESTVMYLCVRGIVMYLCVRGIEFASFYNFFDQFLEMFRQCDIFVFHFISLYWNRCHCKYSFWIGMNPIYIIGLELSIYSSSSSFDFLLNHYEIM